MKKLMNTKAELKKAGYTKTVKSFKQLLHDVFDESFKEYTTEQVLFDPELTRAFDILVRCVSGCPKLSDYVINRSLDNERKAGRGKHRT